MGSGWTTASVTRSAMLCVPLIATTTAFLALHTAHQRCSFIHLCNHSFIHSTYIHSLTLPQALTHSLVHSSATFVPCLTHALIHPITYLLMHSFLTSCIAQHGNISGAPIELTASVPYHSRLCTKSRVPVQHNHTGQVQASPVVMTPVQHST